MDDCLEFESDPSWVAVAREFVRDRLRVWNMAELVEDAVLVASELVSNAVLHARTGVQVRVVGLHPGVRIEVRDENSRVPTLPAVGPDATSGHGLALVAGLATSWGIEQRGDGKVVWAELGGRHAGTAS